MSKHSASRAFFVFTLLLLMVRADPSWGQEGISITNFNPSTSVGSLFELVLAEPKEHLQWSAGGMLDYAHEPLYREWYRAGDQGTAYPAKARLTGHLFGALGLGGMTELGLALPVIVYQNGEGGNPGGEIQHAGLGDPRVDFKARVFDGAITKLGILAVFTAPLGHYASSGEDFLGSEAPTLDAGVILEGHTGPVILAMNGGFLVRKPAVIGTFEQTHAITWNLGVAWDVKEFGEPGGLRLGIEANGQANINFDARSGIPIEALGGVKYRLPNDLVLTAGAGPGLSRGVGTPVFRLFAGITFDKVVRDCPAGPEDIDGFEDHDRCIDPDNDQDGILDVDDQCINDPEDLDGYQDQDGCAEPDNDGDEIQDAVDSCPMIPEDMDGYQDEDGCPEEGPGKAVVKITDTQLLVSSKIYFDFDKASIKEVSYPILDAVAEALLANPHLQRVQVEGHTDNEGTEEYNVSLSEARAKSVADYLVSKGVPQERLTYKGYGFSRPKASNTSEEGKAINRRVEFTIIRGD